MSGGAHPILISRCADSCEFSSALAVPEGYWGEPPNGGSYRAGRYVWHQGDSDQRMISASEGICFLAGVTGKFRGEGERVVISPGPDGYWYLLGTSQQTEVGAMAECFWYDPR